MGSEVELAPLRSIEDFLLQSARFQIPNHKEPERWINRVNNNLLYYQTNYFVMIFLVFLVVGMMHPLQFLYGFTAICVAFGIFVYVTNNKQTTWKFKKDHPLVSVCIIIASGYFVVTLLGSVFVFLVGIALPLLLVFLHASMRLRNVKNKIANKMEMIGLRKTPMGLFLDALGQEQGG